MQMMVAVIYQVVAVFACLTALTVVFGYVRLLNVRTEIVRAFAWSQVLTFGAYAIRAIYWSLRPIFTHEMPVERLAQIGNVNIWLDVIVIFGAYCALRAIYFMVPEAERAAWSWLTAWLYPDHWTRGVTTRVRGWIWPNRVNSE